MFVSRWLEQQFGEYKRSLGVKFDLVLSRTEWYARINAPFAEADEITEKLRRLHISVSNHRLDPGEVRAWSTRYERYVPEQEPSALPKDIAEISGGLRTEKLLEYYISTTVGKLEKGMRVADLGSADSGFLNMAVQEYGCEGWAVDPSLAGMSAPAHPKLHYIPNIISKGGTQLPPLDLMTLHCSFEMFSPEEMSTVFELAQHKLLPKGKLIIVPLYLAPKRTIYSDALCQVPVLTESDHAGKIGVRDYWSVPWSEWHSPETLESRLIRPYANLSATIYKVANPHEIHPGCFLRFFGMWQNKNEVRR